MAETKNDKDSKLSVAKNDKKGQVSETKKDKAVSVAKKNQTKPTVSVAKQDQAKSTLSVAKTQAATTVSVVKKDQVKTTASVAKEQGGQLAVTKHDQGGQLAVLGNDSGLKCLERLFARFRPNVNFSALLNDELKDKYAADPLETLLELANTQDLRPEAHKDVAEIAKTYSGPALLALQGDKWIFIQDLQQINAGPGLTIIDPGYKDPNKPIMVPIKQIIERSSGKLIIFRNLQEINIGQQSALFCFCSIAKHHEVKVDIRRIMHEYAIDDNEVSEALLLEISHNYEFKARKMKLTWDKVIALDKAYPAIGIKQNGKYLVICGTRKKEETDELVVLDPDVKDGAKPTFQFWSREQFEAECTDNVILLKKIYRLSDEKRPFGLGWFIPEFVKLKGVFGQIAITVVLITLLSLVVPLFFQIVVDKVLVNRTYNTLNVLGIGILAAVIFSGFLGYVRSYFLLYATNKIDISTATKTFSHLMRLPIDFFERMPSGVILKHMQQTEKIRGFLSGNLFFTILDLFSLVIFIPFLFFYSVQLTLVTLGFSAMMAIVLACLIKPFQRRLNELYQAEGKRQSMLVESIHGVRTVKSLALEPIKEKQWDDSTAYAIKSYFQVGKISMTAKSISQVLQMMMTISIIWLGAHLVFDQKITIGALIAFQMLSGRVTGPLVKMIGLIHEYQQIALSVKMLGVVMNTPIDPVGGGVRNPLRGQISFENVTFQYRPELPQVIRNFSLDIPQGSTMGIVGRSGSGKSTLTKLLQGLYPIGQGLVKVDGIDIREIDKPHLRSSIGIVLQENYFFSGPIRDNISLTKRNASIEEIIYAAKLAGADEFIQQQTRGYDTVLEENASNLSGGQKQRLAIARALLANPSILIFDEATSALDPESEHVIQTNLKAISKGRTVIIISHRLSIVRNADKILIIDKGERIDLGTHQELLAKPGVYQEFWNQQMHGGA
jgi:ATP-binding cassette, subfamily B, bacterial HlyB/CyaB